MVSQECLETACFPIVVVERASLFPNTITLLKIEFGSQLAYNQVLRRQKCQSDHPWKILTEFLVQDPVTSIMTVTIVSSKLCHFNPGDILGHVQITNIKSIFNQTRVLNQRIVYTNNDSDEYETIVHNTKQLTL